MYEEDTDLRYIITIAFYRPVSQPSVPNKLVEDVIKVRTTNHIGE